MFRILITLLLFISSTIVFAQKDSGFRGIWYHIGNTNNEFVHKYSGGLGTYPANHYPFSIYSKKATKTFFCYGGASMDAKPSLLHEVAYFDHRTKKVSRPTIVLDKKTNDAHDNPVISMDDQGFIWLFSTSHGVERESYIHKSKKPNDISSFEKVNATFLKDGLKKPFNNFSYLQIYHVPNQGFLGLMTHYERGMLKFGSNKPRRTIGYITSKNGVEWSEIKNIAEIEEGHYQSSAISEGSNQTYKIASVFNFHPNTEKGAGLDYRTNLYYISTKDFGKTWQNEQGENVTLPLKEINNEALIRDFQSENKLVYINDVGFDKNQNPCISYITSLGPDPGPKNGPHVLETACWSKSQWIFKKVIEVDHNYDMGSIFYDNNKWKLIVPTEAAPQKYGTGGELAFWSLKNDAWKKEKPITQNSSLNHSYPRKTLNSHKDFYAIWADGNAREPSESSIYFCDSTGNVFKLPRNMNADMEKPLKVILKK